MGTCGGERGDGKAYACNESGLAGIVGAADHYTDRLWM